MSGVISAGLIRWDFLCWSDDAVKERGEGMKKGFNIFSFVLSMVAGQYCAFGATVPSVYDERSGRWIGDVDALTNAFVNVKAYETIVLSKGVYDLSPVTNRPLYNAGGGSYGASLLGLPWVKGVKIVGETGKPEDVVLKAENSEYRILVLHTPNAELHGVTITGGNASGKHINTYNYRRGGAIILANDVIVSNCVFHGNKADVSGGAVSGANGLFGKVYDSIFTNNNCNIAGMAASMTTIYRCGFTNNVSVGEAAKNYEASVVHSSHVYDSGFAYNRGNGTGGVNGGSATRCTFMFNRSENLVQNNDASNAGGGGARRAALTNCTFYGNSAYDQGGAIYYGSAVGCKVVSNIVRRALTDLYAYGGGISHATLVDGCTVVSNYAGYGGGVEQCGLVTNTVLAYNRAQRGGGANASVLIDCEIANNAALDYGYSEHGGQGGGLRYGSATDCVFKYNYGSATGGSEYLKNCEIIGSRVDAEVIDSCVLHDISNRHVSLAEGNVSYPDGMAVSNMYMVGESLVLMRNTLITNCDWRASLNTENCAMFRTDETGFAKVENCTIADNIYCYLLRPPDKNNTFYFSFVNSVFAGNRSDSTALCDVSGYDSFYMTLTNCAYSVMNWKRRAKQPEGVEDSNCIELEQNNGARFVTWENAPRYTPKRTSPLRGKGLMFEWMNDESTDLAGNPRVRDGKVDVGCYQCWLEPVGMSIKVK